VQWVAADVTKWYPTQLFEIWHDRAAFHFFTDSSDRAATVVRLNKSIKRGGSVIIGTFVLVPSLSTVVTLDPNQMNQIIRHFEAVAGRKPANEDEVNVFEFFVRSSRPSW
jgi:hypothetical protein